jgi:sporulation protein YpjB
MGGTRMKKMIMVWFFFSIFFVSLVAMAEDTTSEEFKKLDEISNYAWQLSKQNRFEEAIQLLQYFDQEFKNIPINTKVYSVDELHVLTSSHHKALDALEKETIDPDEKIKAVTQFRLVVDAMTSEHQPLWGTMEEPIMTTFSHLKSDMEEGDLQGFQQEWNEFLSLYGIIYPSLTVDVDDQNIKRVETHISAIEGNMFLELSEHTKFQQLLAMEEALQDIFHHADKNESDPSLLWVILTTGSIILLALTYAGWKKYKADLALKLQRKEIDK